MESQVSRAQGGADSLGLRGEIFANAADRVALVIVQREEFKSVAQALPISHDRANFDRIRSQRQRDFQRDDLARLEAPREGGTDTILPHLSRASPARPEFPRLKHLYLQPDINHESGEASGVLNFSGRSLGRRSCAGVSACGSGDSFLVFAHANIASANLRPDFGRF